MALSKLKYVEKVYKGDFEDFEITFIRNNNRRISIPTTTYLQRVHIRKDYSAFRNRPI